jgi:hypothetical protein
MTDHSAATRAADQARADAEHAEAARREADVLVRRTRYLLSNGIDLRDPTHLASLATDQAMDAVKGATLASCCQGAASLSLLAELARRLAEIEAGR